jgi:16S rRNA (guanine1207-N2)-methyltransferase
VRPVGDQGHYFDASPATPSARTTVRLDLPDRSIELVTDRGVFSADRVDPGTRYLLLEAPAPAPSGTFVDLGAGYGPIACTLALRSPGATVWAVEVNERARELCTLNAERAGATNVRVVAPDDVPHDLTVDLIWSNPPIRIGKAALHHLLGTWFDRLSPAGEAVLVVQKHLGADSLHRWLEGRGHPTTMLGSRAGYRLLQVASKGEDR